MEIKAHAQEIQNQKQIAREYENVVKNLVVECYEAGANPKDSPDPKDAAEIIRRIINSRIDSVAIKLSGTQYETAQHLKEYLFPDVVHELMDYAGTRLFAEALELALNGGDTSDMPDPIRQIVEEIQKTKPEGATFKDLHIHVIKI